MTDEAASAGFLASEHFGKFPRVQKMACLVMMAVRLKWDSAKAAGRSKRFMFWFFAKPIEVVYLLWLSGIIPDTTRNLSVIKNDSG